MWHLISFFVHLFEMLNFYAIYPFHPIFIGHTAKKWKNLMTIKSLLNISLLLSSTLLSCNLWADTTLTFTDTNPKGETRTSSIQIHGNTVRTNESDSDIYTLFDTEKKTMYTINPDVKQYMEANIDTIKDSLTTAMKMQENMKAQMKEQLSKMPEEQRKAFEQQMEAVEKQEKMPPPKVDITPSDKTDTVQGLSCKIITISVNGKPIKESCISKDGIDEKDMSQLKSMFNFMESVAVETAKIRGLPAPDAETMPSHQDGVAIRVKGLINGVKSELSKLSTDTLEDKDFTIPEGFTVFKPQAVQKPMTQAPTPTK